MLTFENTFYESFNHEVEFSAIKIAFASKSQYTERLKLISTIRYSDVSIFSSPNDY